MPGVGIGIRPNLPETQAETKAETPKFDFLFLIFPHSVHHRLILLIHPVYLILLRAPFVEYSGRYTRSVFRGFFLFILVVATYVKKTIIRAISRSLKAVRSSHSIFAPHASCLPSFSLSQWWSYGKTSLGTSWPSTSNIRHRVMSMRLRRPLIF